MAFRILFTILLLTCSGKLAYTSTPSANIAPNQPLELPGTPRQLNTSTPQTAALLNASHLDPFPIPGTKIELHFSRFGELISQAELDLCIVEGVSSLFGTVLNKGKDGPLPLNAAEYKYGNVVINMYDFSPPRAHMTYSSVVATLRGIALFSNIYWYRAATIDVYEGKTGHVGTGNFGPIIPGRDRNRLVAREGSE